MSPGRDLVAGQRVGDPARRSGALAEPLTVSRQKLVRHLDIQRSESESWILVYLDVVTLLLVAFVLVVAHMQSARAPVDTQDREPFGLASSVADPAPPRPAADRGATAGGGLLPGASGLLPAPGPQLVEQDLVRSLRSRDGLGDLEIEAQPGRVNLILPENILFNVGRADLIGSAGVVLREIAPILLQYGVTVSVEGHTDDVPIRTGQFPSNWELSAARATVVVRQLVAFGVPSRLLRAIGYADTRPIATNGDAAGRQSNRRVNLVLHLDPGNAAD